MVQEGTVTKYSTPHPAAHNAIPTLNPHFFQADIGKSIQKWTANRKQPFICTRILLKDMQYLKLPLLYTKPPFQMLKHALDELKPVETKDFETPEPLDKGTRQWLSSLACSELSWIAEEKNAEELKSLASRRLAMECGVTASSARTRTIELGDSITIILNEPGITEDHLGRLTWGSSLVLSQKLVSQPDLVAGKRVLELGAGTGLCGITASHVGAKFVHVTDLPDIVPNLEQNVQLNKAQCKAYVLDWTQPEVEAEIDVCIISDPVYSREHPAFLLQAVRAVSAFEILLELPLRIGFEGERQQIRDGLMAQGYLVKRKKEDTGQDLFGEQTFEFSHYSRSR